MSCLVGPKTTSKSGDKTAHKAHKGPNISRCHARTHALRVKRGERQVEADPASRRRRRRRRDQAAAGAGAGAAAAAGSSPVTTAVDAPAPAAPPAAPQAAAVDI